MAKKRSKKKTARSRRRGRRPLLEKRPALRDKIIEALELGMPANQVSKLVGLAAGTLNEWRRKGEDDLLTKKDSVYAAFALRVEAAELEAQRRALQCIQDGISGWNERTEENTKTPEGVTSKVKIVRKRDPRLALEFLGRLDPANWSPKQEVTHSGAVTKRIVLDGAVDPSTVLPPAVVADEAAAQGGGGSDPG